MSSGSGGAISGGAISVSMSTGSSALPPNNSTTTAPTVESHVQVAVRCRPLNEREKAAGRPPVLQCKTNSNEIAVAKRKNYSFDKVYGQYSTQKDVFKATVKPVVDEALAGYNCTVFAYGQTGTGKTHTMQGALSPDDEMAGIIPRCVRYIFDALQSSSQEYSVKVSFLQLYNEELKDLLAPESKKLRLMEDPKRGGIYCQNLLEVTTTTAGQVFELLEAGVKNRITSETLMNENSSRSHSIFTIRIHSKESNPGGEDLIKTGQLNLVDLAGSECVGRSGARNARAREAGNINQSLLTLGRVITALVDNHPHIPYRDSKLTRLLQESLGGRTKTTIIATLAPCADSIDETLSTLEYAYRAKNIKNKPEVNQKTTKAGLLKEYGNEIETLRNALQAARSKDGIYLPPAQFAEMQERISGQAVQLSELEDELEVRNKACKELEEEVEHQKAEMKEMERAKQNAEDKLEQVQSELTETQERLNLTSAKLAKTEDELHAFQANEKVLLANGEKAAALFQESEERAVRLMEKIERKRRVAESNSSLASSFSEKSAAQIAAFQERLQHHHGEQEAFVLDVSKSIEQLQSAHSTNVEELMKALGSLQTLMRTRRELQEEENEEERQANKQLSGNFEQSINDMESAMQSDLETLINLSSSHASKIAKELDVGKEQNVKFLEDVEAKLSHSRTEMAHFLSEQSQKLLELQATIDESIEEQTTQVQANKESLVAALKDTHKKQQHELAEMKKQLTLYVDKCVATQAEKLQEQTSFIERNASEQEQQLKSVRNVTERDILTSVKALSSQNTKQETTSTELQGRVVSMRSEVNEAGTRHGELIKFHLTEQKQSIERTAQSDSASSKKLLELVAEQSGASAAAIDRRQTSTNAFIGRHEELRSTLSDGYSTLQEGLESNVGATKRKFEVVSQLAETVVEDATKDSTQQRHELETYMKKRKIDEATGSTPTKKSFSFPSFQATKIASESDFERGSFGQRLEEASSLKSFVGASKASTASTSSVHSNESDEDPVDNSARGSENGQENDTASQASEVSTSSKSAPPTPSGIKSNRFAPHGTTSGVSNDINKLKSAADRKLKFGSKSASSIQAPKKFR